jgi:spore germination cell wall hydrolase CwlJ-like protein
MMKYLPKFFVILLVTFSAMFGTNNFFHWDDVWSPYVVPGVKHIPIPKIVIIPQVNEQELECMARNIYHEARGEPIEGQIAVARVVLNRIYKGFGKTPCSVINQSHYVKVPDENGLTTLKKVCQFHWVCDEVTTNKNSIAYKRAYKIAYDVLTKNKYEDILPKNILFFHATYIEPVGTYKQKIVIGNHLFYSRK